MNNTSLAMLENHRIEFLKKYELDPESIKKFKEKIQKVSEEESIELGKKLFELISKKEFNDDYEKALELIYKGANVEYKSQKKGNFSLLICARKNYLKTFLALVKAGANINQVNKYLTPSVMSSARHGNKEILEILIIMGADINLRCLDGDNAIMSAKRHDRVECFDLLVKASSYLTNRNLANQTLMDIPSKETFDLSNFSITISPISSDITISFDATQSLLQEATKKLEKYRQ